MKQYLSQYKIYLHTKPYSTTYDFTHSF